MVGQPIEHRLSHLLSGTPAAIAINIYGDDLNKLRSIAKEIEQVLKTLPGTRDVNANREVMITSLPIRYRHGELSSFGLTPAEAAGQVREAMYGKVVDTVNQGTKQFLFSGLIALDYFLRNIFVLWNVFILKRVVILDRSIFDQHTKFNSNK